jgi:hypothetical protein
VRQSLPTHYLRKQTATAPTVLALDLSAVSLLADAVPGLVAVAATHGHRCLSQDGGRGTGVMSGVVGADIMSGAPVPRQRTAGSGTFVEDDANLTTRIRNAPDTIDTTPSRDR